MEFDIKFSNNEIADEFAQNIKYKNLRGVKVSRKQAEPEQGALSVAEWMPLITLAVKSGLAASAVTGAFSLLKGLLVENKKTTADKETEQLRITSNEKIEMAKTENQSNFINFTIRCGDKDMSFKLTKGSEAEMQDLMATIKLMKDGC